MSSRRGLQLEGLLTVILVLGSHVHCSTKCGCSCIMTNMTRMLEPALPVGPVRMHTWCKEHTYKHILFPFLFFSFPFLFTSTILSSLPTSPLPKYIPLHLLRVSPTSLDHDFRLLPALLLLYSHITSDWPPHVQYVSLRINHFSFPIGYPVVSQSPVPRQPT